jgi:hypothetical protein
VDDLKDGRKRGRDGKRYERNRTLARKEQRNKNRRKLRNVVGDEEI